MGRKKEAKLLGIAPTFVATLFYKSIPKLLPSKLSRAITKECDSEVEHLSEKPDLLMYAFPEYKITHHGTEIPPQCVILPIDHPRAGNKKDEKTVQEIRTRALRQAWDWDTAAETIDSSPFEVAVCDMFAHGLEYKKRLSLFRGAIAAICSIAPFQALLWLPSERFVNPKDFKKRYSSDPLFPAVNVRLFNLEGRKGELLMDTLGLAAIGLPDLQCHFKKLEANDVAGILYNYADYIFQKGDVIEDGNTVQGLTPDQKWVCQHEMSLAEPRRMVIDLNPGVGFAAGNRTKR